MSKCFKRYEYWGCKDGKPMKMVTEWFSWNTEYKPKWQLNNKLQNWYKD